MRLNFIFSEVGIGLRRNLTLTVAVIVSVAISLGLFGAALLLRSSVENVKGYWYDKVEVTVYLCGESSIKERCPAGNVTDEQRKQIEENLKASPLVEKVYYESPQEAYQNFQESSAGSDSALFENITPEQMPESFRVKLKNPEQYAAIAGQFQGAPGVDSVEDQRKVLEGLFRVFGVVQIGAVTLAVIQAVAALMLIINTIRLAAFNRRREIGIMRLVGASNLYIRLPFLMEGAVAGLVGAVLGSLMLVGFKFFLIDKQLGGKIDGNYALVPWGDVIATIPWLIVSGAVVSGLISALALRRYLRV